MKMHEEHVKYQYENQNHVEYSENSLGHQVALC